MTSSWLIDPDCLQGHLNRFSESYLVAEPFPHAVIDDFLPEVLAKEIVSLFPAPGFGGFEQPDNEHQVNKLGRTQEHRFHGLNQKLVHFLLEMNSMIFIDFLEQLTGIKGLIADPNFSGGALHQILPGGKLDVHADFNWYGEKELYRRVNCLLYLNHDWSPDYGGELELWDAGMENCEVSVMPIFNRCVIFNTSATSYHGHPNILACPQGMTRKSIATYYYTSRPSEDVEPHSTLWQQPAQQNA